VAVPSIKVAPSNMITLSLFFTSVWLCLEGKGDWATISLLLPLSILLAKVEVIVGEIIRDDVAIITTKITDNGLTLSFLIT
jgi:hypothetical protein